jgi:hypothetical protein
MATMKELIALTKLILLQERDRRSNVRELSYIARGRSKTIPEIKGRRKLIKILEEFGTDLVYYEPDLRIRGDEKYWIDDDSLVKILKEALVMLEEFGFNVT